ncbi:MAG: tetratricopeptide repeat protein [Flavobacteriia bacterium]|nr:tetratricopeptide repeat protein [Flavobacteriia bacterium]
MKFKKDYFILILLFNFFFFYSQSSNEKNKNIDSLKKIIASNKHDSIKINALSKWDDLIYLEDLKLDNELNEKIIEIAKNNLNKKKVNSKEKEWFKKAIAKSYNILGNNNKIKGKYLKSIELLNKALIIYKEINYNSGQADAFTNLGNVYNDIGNSNKSISYFINAISIYENAKDEEKLGFAFNSIGLAFSRLNDYPKAEYYYKKALKVKLKTGNKKSIALTYNNLGALYVNQNKLDEAIHFFEKCLKIRNEINDKDGIGMVYNNLGTIYKRNNENNKALDFYKKSIEIRKKTENILGLSISYTNLGSLYLQMNDYSNAIKYAILGLKTAEDVISLDDQLQANNLLYLIYRKKNNHYLSLIYLEKLRKIEDSLKSIQKKEEIYQKEFEYEIGKINFKDSINKVNQKIKINAMNDRISSINSQRFTLYGGIFISLILLLLFYSKYKKSNIQQKIILSQKEIVEEKNKEITDSITYAKRIQSAILPSNKVVQSILPQSFILYKPKDIVAGDFYWLELIGDSVLFAAADCTGHGVPGAMVSVVCNNGLNRAVREFGLAIPNEILNKTRELVVAEFEKSDENVNDGMDISLCSLNIKSKLLFWAGANNPLWVLRDKQIIDYKPDKQPIGKQEGVKPFTNHVIQLQEHDCIYIFTDGFQDQFGGPKQKKFRSSQIKELLLSISEKCMEDQLNEIEKKLVSWKGDLEQVDDICLIGVKI